VRAIARQYAGHGEPLDDLVQVGTIGLIKAINGFDPSAARALPVRRPDDRRRDQAALSRSELGGARSRRLKELNATLASSSTG
jgi:RNA polymerase sigma-B factor